MVLPARVDVRGYQPQGALGQRTRAGQRVDLLLIRRQGGRDLEVVDPSQRVQESVVYLVWWQLGRTSGWLSVGRVFGRRGASGSDSRGRTYGRYELTSVHAQSPL